MAVTWALTDDQPADRKARGAFFTPPSVAEFIAHWAIRSKSDLVFEPSCGEAAFLMAAGRRLEELGRTSARIDQLAGTELHQQSALSAAGRLGSADIQALVQVGDFLASPAEPRYDAVVGNPPYVRYQDFSGIARSVGQTAANAGGVKLSGLASSWAAFVVHAAEFLRRPGGRMGLVLPAELLSVNYAAQVRRFLLREFGSVRLILFEERIFPGVLEDVVLLLVEGVGPTSACEVTKVKRAADLGPHLAFQPFVPPPDGGKWTSALLTQTAAATYDNVLRHSTFVPLERWGRAALGMVTGNNKFFTMTPKEAAERKIGGTELVRISPPGSSHLRGLDLSLNAWGALGDDSRRTLLFRPSGDDLSDGAAALVAEGEARSVDQAYKCRVRTPWWRVPVLPAPDLFITYMNMDTARLCTNTAGVRHLNSVHGLTLKEDHRHLGRSYLALASLNSVTLLGAEVVGRSYGGGMLKLEPREAAQLPLPSPETVAAATSELDAIRPLVAAALRRRDLPAAVKLVDERLLHGTSGLTRKDLKVIRAEREELLRRRLIRGSKADGTG